MAINTLEHSKMDGDGEGVYVRTNGNELVGFGKKSIFR